jgi:hypothetical protein
MCEDSLRNLAKNVIAARPGQCLQRVPAASMLQGQGAGTLAWRSHMRKCSCLIHSSATAAQPPAAQMSALLCLSSTAAYEQRSCCCQPLAVQILQVQSPAEPIQRRRRAIELGRLLHAQSTCWKPQITAGRPCCWTAGMPARLAWQCAG